MPRQSKTKSDATASKNPAKSVTKPAFVKYRLAVENVVADGPGTNYSSDLESEFEEHDNEPATPVAKTPEKPNNTRKEKNAANPVPQSDDEIHSDAPLVKNPEQVTIPRRRNKPVAVAAGSKTGTFAPRPSKRKLTLTRSPRKKSKMDENHPATVVPSLSDTGRHSTANKHKAGSQSIEQSPAMATSKKTAALRQATLEKIWIRSRDTASNEVTLKNVASRTGSPEPVNTIASAPSSTEWTVAQPATSGPSTPRSTIIPASPRPRIASPDLGTSPSTDLYARIFSSPAARVVSTPPPVPNTPPPRTPTNPTSPTANHTRLSSSGRVYAIIPSSSTPPPRVRLPSSSPMEPKGYTKKHDTPPGDQQQRKFWAQEELTFGPRLGKEVWEGVERLSLARGKGGDEENFRRKMRRAGFEY